MLAATIAIAIASASASAIASAVASAVDEDVDGTAARYSLIQVVFSCTYLSSACRDLSRPNPDCL